MLVMHSTISFSVFYIFIEDIFYFASLAVPGLGILVIHGSSHPLGYNTVCTFCFCIYFYSSFYFTYSCGLCLPIWVDLPKTVRLPEVDVSPSELTYLKQSGFLWFKLLHLN